MKEKVTIVKVGGAVVEDEARLARLLAGFSRLPGRKILVHGGGRSATAMAAKLGIETRMVNGRRITDEAMLQVVTMVYGGLVNKRVVARLQAEGINALGLTGADMNVMRSHRRPVKDGIDYGHVGDVEEADAQALHTLIKAGITPVMAPLTHDGKGNLLNTNADTIAAETAKALAQRYDVTLIYGFEKPGVMANPDDPQTLIPLITPDGFRQLVDNGTISGGMIPKVENALEAVSCGVCQVVITSVETIDGQHGTMVRAR
ncbi:MAG: acetylglutamate kinase [Prevotella sp.]